MLHNKVAIIFLVQNLQSAQFCQNLMWKTDIDSEEFVMFRIYQVQRITCAVSIKCYYWLSDLFCYCDHIE